MGGLHLPYWSHELHGRQARWRHPSLTSHKQKKSHSRHETLFADNKRLFIRYYGVFALVADCEKTVWV
jgi:hypothetical protein